MPLLQRFKRLKNRSSQCLSAGLLSVMSASLLAFPAPVLAAADWPMFKHDAARSGQVERPRIDDPRVLWKVPVGIAGWLNSPVIADGMVFVGSGGTYWDEPDYEAFSDTNPTEGVYAFDLRTGERKWHTPSKNDVANVVWADDKIIATGDEGAIWALDPKTGKRLWHTELTGIGFQLLPLKTKAGERVIVGDSEGQLSWVDTRTGKIVLKAKLDGSIRAGAASDGQLVFTATTQGTVYVFDAQTGKQKWKQSLSELYTEAVDATLEVYGAPTLVNDTLVIGFARDTTYNTPALIALNKKTGKLTWSGQADTGKTDFGNIRTSPALYKQSLFYAEPYSNQILTVNAHNGQLEHYFSAGLPMFPQWSSPAIAGNLVYVPRFDGGLYAVEARDGKLRWEFYLGIPNLAGPKLPDALNQDEAYWMPPIGDAIYASPAIAADGRILIPAAGYLYCIGED